jgi:hypothetical protein
MGFFISTFSSTDPLNEIEAQILNNGNIMYFTQAKKEFSTDGNDEDEYEVIAWIVNPNTNSLVGGPNPIQVTTPTPGTGDDPAYVVGHDIDASGNVHIFTMKASFSGVQSTTHTIQETVLDANGNIVSAETTVATLSRPGVRQHMHGGTMKEELIDPHSIQATLNDAGELVVFYTSSLEGTPGTVWSYEDGTITKEHETTDAMSRAGGAKLVDLGNGTYSYALRAGTSAAAQVHHWSGAFTLSTMTPCFVRGTLIKTDRGDVAVEDLEPGMQILTMDDGYRPLRWIKSTKAPAFGSNAPIKIAKGTLNNTRDLYVSPQHRMMIRKSAFELAFGDGEVLVPAVALLNDTTITRQVGGMVEYFHLMFDRHEVVYANNAPAESFDPGDIGICGFGEEAREEIYRLFPELRDDASSFGETARVTLTVRETLAFANKGQTAAEMV